MFQDATTGVYWDEVRYDLKDTLNFAKDVDVFLESLTINNPALSGTGNMYLVVDFDFMNERSISNNSNFRNRFVIPNENTSSSGANQIMKYHLKSNYIGRLTGTEKGSIRNIVARFMNEDGEVTRGNLKQLEIENGTKVTFQSISSATITTDQTVHNVAIFADEQIFTRDGTLIGTVSSTSGTDIVLSATPTVNLIADEPLYYKAGRTEISINGAKLSGVTSLTVDKNSSAASADNIQAEGITKRITDSSSGEIVKRGTILYTPNRLYYRRSY